MYEDGYYNKKLKNFIENNKRKNVKINIPYWYEFLFFKKNIMLRFRSNNFFSFLNRFLSPLF